MLKSWPIINGYEMPLSFLSDRTVPSLGFHVSFLFAGKRDYIIFIYYFHLYLNITFPEL